MGIKSWIGIGIGLLAIGGFIYYRKKEEDESYERVQARVMDVDQKHKDEIEAKKKEEAESEFDNMIAEVDQAMSDMKISHEQQVTETIDQIVDGLHKEMGMTQEQIDSALEKAVFDNGENAKDWIDGCFDKMTISNEKQLNEKLNRIMDELHIEKPWKGDFKEFLGDKSKTLDFS